MNAQQVRGLCRAVLLALLVFVGLVFVGVVFVGLVFVAGPVQSAAGAAEPSIELAVTDVSPSTVPPTGGGTVTFTLQLTNRTDSVLQDVTVVLRRGAPIDSERALDDALANPEPSPAVLSTTPQDKPLGGPLAAHATTTVVYPVSVSTQLSSDICLCKQPGTVYPVEFSAVVDGQDAGYTQTYLPAFGQLPQPVPVGWLWPLVDRPHRFNQDTLFLDDDLAASFASGRLSRVLSVVEQLPATVRITLVVDPGLVDEAAVMASGNYQVETASGPVAGTGAAAAADWLSRLRTVLHRNEVTLTPWGDPDINSLTAAGLPWSPGVPPAEQARVSKALGGDFGTSVLLPPADAITPQALAAAEQNGIRTVLISDTQLPGTEGQSSLAVLPGAAALVTDAATQRLVGKALTADQAATNLPALLSRVSLRASQNPADPNYLVLTPDRYVDPAVDRAVRAITDTTTSFFTTPLPAERAAATLTPDERGPLGDPTADNLGRLPPANLDAALRGQQAIATLRSTVPESSAYLAGLPLAIRGDESAWWLRDPLDGAAFGQRLDTLAGSMTSAVSIVRPAEGSYTLGSSDSYLFVTVANQLPAPARVMLSVSTLGGVAGFRADDVAQELPANSRLTLKVPVHAERSGRFQVVGVLHSPSGAQLGTPLPLSVRAESLGGIGVVITEVAAGVLALAVCLRVFRRVKARRAPVGRW